MRRIVIVAIGARFYGVVAQGKLAEHLGLPYRHVFFTPQVFRSPSTTPPWARRMHQSRPVNGLLWQDHLARRGPPVRPAAGRPDAGRQRNPAGALLALRGRGS
jgi:hypothetical protein